MKYELSKISSFDSLILFLSCLCAFVVNVFISPARTIVRDYIALPHGLSSVTTLLFSPRHCQILLPIENIGIRMTRKENMKDELWIMSSLGSLILFLLCLCAFVVNVFISPARTIVRGYIALPHGLPSVVTLFFSLCLCAFVVIVFFSVPQCPYCKILFNLLPSVWLPVC